MPPGSDRTPLPRQRQPHIDWPQHTRHPGPETRPNAQGPGTGGTQPAHAHTPCLSHALLFSTVSYELSSYSRPMPPTSGRAHRPELAQQEAAPAHASQSAAPAQKSAWQPATDLTGETPMDATDQGTSLQNAEQTGLTATSEGPGPAWQAGQGPLSLMGEGGIPKAQPPNRTGPGQQAPGAIAFKQHDQDPRTMDQPYTQHPAVSGHQIPTHLTRDPCLSIPKDWATLCCAPPLPTPAVRTDPHGTPTNPSGMDTHLMAGATDQGDSGKGDTAETALPLGEAIYTVRVGISGLAGPLELGPCQVSSRARDHNPVVETTEFQFYAHTTVLLAPDLRSARTAQCNMALLNTKSSDARPRLLGLIRGSHSHPDARPSSHAFPQLNKGLPRTQGSQGRVTSMAQGTHNNTNKHDTATCGNNRATWNHIGHLRLHARHVCHLLHIRLFVTGDTELHPGPKRTARPTQYMRTQLLAGRASAYTTKLASNHGCHLCAGISKQTMALLWPPIRSEACPPPRRSGLTPPLYLRVARSHGKYSLATPKRAPRPIPALIPNTQQGGPAASEHDHTLPTPSLIGGGKAPKTKMAYPTGPYIPQAPSKQRNGAGRRRIDTMMAAAVPGLVHDTPTPPTQAPNGSTAPTFKDSGLDPIMFMNPTYASNDYLLDIDMLETEDSCIRSGAHAPTICLSNQQGDEGPPPRVTCLHTRGLPGQGQQDTAMQEAEDIACLLRSDKEAEDMHLTPAALQQAPTWVRPQSVGLYCQKQDAGHCAIHALNAMAGKQILSPLDAQRLLAHPQVPGPARGRTRDCDNNGWYTIEAINKLLYYSTTSDVALMMVLSTAAGPQVQHTQQSLLSQAPPGCNSLYVHIPGHFVCWKQSPVNGRWYILDSIPYAEHGQVREVTPSDWAGCQGTFSTSVRADAYLHNTTAMQLSRTRQLWMPQAQRQYADLSHTQFQRGPTQRPAAGWIVQDNDAAPRTRRGANLTIHEPPHQPPQLQQQPPRHVSPTAVGLYCEPQASHYCGAHALNAYIGSPAVQGHTIHAALTTPGLPPPIDSGMDAIIHPHGNWHITQLNRFLYLNCHQLVTIAHVLDAFPGITYSREDILSKYAPLNCTALIVHHAHHYKCWKQSPTNREWYELD